VSKYIFTRGNCGSGTAHEGIEINYSYSTLSRSWGAPSTVDLNSLTIPGFPDTNYSQPISLSDWKVNPEEALRIFSGHGGLPIIQNSETMLLRQTGDQLMWLYLSQGGESSVSTSYEVRISATTGQRISSNTYTQYAPL